jgi:hypothetical protein
MYQERGGETGWFDINSWETEADICVLFDENADDTSE